MANSKKVYLTPSIFLAFVDRANQKHNSASAFFRYFGQEEYQLYTDLPSLLTSYNYIYEKISPSLAKDFMRSMQISSLNVLFPEERDFKAALKTLINYRTTDLTFPEALMSVLANRYHISQICTFDYLHPLFGLTLFFIPV